MAARVWRTLVLVAIGLGLTIVGQVPGQSQGGGRHHPGRVMDIDNQAPLGASVKAWPQSNRTGNEGNCPAYGNAPIDQMTSKDGDGRFQLTVDSKYRTYTVTYCRNGYVPRVDRMPNRADGSSVIPTPARIQRVASPQEQAQFDELVVRRVVTVMNDLAYLRSVNADRFNAAMRGLASDFSSSADGRRAEVIGTLSRLTEAWNAQ